MSDAQRAVIAWSPVLVRNKMRVWLKCGAEATRRRSAKDAVGDTASVSTCILHWLESINPRPPSLGSLFARGVCEVILSLNTNASLFYAVHSFTSLDVPCPWPTFYPSLPQRVGYHHSLRVRIENTGALRDSRANQVTCSKSRINSLIPDGVKQPSTGAVAENALGHGADGSSQYASATSWLWLCLSHQ
jgi:hypothetical protein